MIWNEAKIIRIFSRGNSEDGYGTDYFAFNSEDYSKALQIINDCNYNFFEEERIRNKFYCFIEYVEDTLQNKGIQYESIGFDDQLEQY